MHSLDVNVVTLTVFLEPTAEILINLNIPDSRVIESAGTVLVEVNLSSPSPEDIEVTLQLLGDSAIGKNYTVLIPNSFFGFNSFLH